MFMSSMMMKVNKKVKMEIQNKYLHLVSILKLNRDLFKKLVSMELIGIHLVLRS